MKEKHSKGRRRLSLGLLGGLLTFLLLSGWSAGSASPPAKPATDEMLFLPIMVEDIPPIVPETTEVLNEETLDQLMDVSPDLSEMTFDGTTDQLDALSLNDVIIGEPSALTPGGFLRKVEDISLSGGQVVVETSPATLEDAIEQGSAEASRQLTPEDVRHAVMMPGVQMLPVSGPNIDDSFYFAINNIVLYDHDGNLSTTNDQLTANGSLEFAINFDLDVKIKNFKVTKVDFSTTVEEEVRLELVAEADVLSFEGEVELANLYMGTMTVFVGPAPIVFTLEMPIALKADGSLSVGITTGVTQSASFTAGIVYNRGAWDTYEYWSNSFDWDPPTPYVGVEVKGYLDPRLQLKLYGVAGPYGTIQPYVKFEAASNATPWWTLSAGIEAKVGVEIEILGQSLGENTEFVLLGYNVILAQAADNGPPYEPSNPDPPDEAVGQPTELELMWTGGDPDGDTVTFVVYLEAGDITPDVPVCEGMPDEYCYVDGLDYDTRYYWQVVATDSEGQSTHGPFWDFKTEVEPENEPPYPPSDPYPPDGASDQPLEPFLEWYGSDPNGDPLTYDVYLEADDTTPDVLVSADQSDPYLEVGPLEPLTDYYWQIVARDSYGATTAGPVWSFSTMDEGVAGPLVCGGPVIGFESGAFPPDWSVESNALPGGEWLVSMDNSSSFWDPGPPPEGVYYASANDDAPGKGSDGSQDYLYTNIIDMSGYVTATLSFYYHFNGDYGHAAGGLEGSTDGGATWPASLTLTTNDEWVYQAVIVDTFAGYEQVQFRFHSDDGGNWAAGFAIDAVSLECGAGSRGLGERPALELSMLKPD